MNEEENDESVFEREANIADRLMRVRSVFNVISAMYSAIDSDEDTLADMNVWLSNLERDVDFLLNVVQIRYDEMQEEDEG